MNLKICELCHSFLVDEEKGICSRCRNIKVDKLIHYDRFSLDMYNRCMLSKIGNKFFCFTTGVYRVPKKYKGFLQFKVKRHKYSFKTEELEPLNESARIFLSYPDLPKRINLKNNVSNYSRVLNGCVSVDYSSRPIRKTSPKVVKACFELLPQYKKYMDVRWSVGVSRAAMRKSFNSLLDAIEDYYLTQQGGLSCTKESTGSSTKKGTI